MLITDVRHILEVESFMVYTLEVLKSSTECESEKRAIQSKIDIIHQFQIDLLRKLVRIYSINIWWLVIVYIIGIFVGIGGGWVIKNTY